MTTYTKQPSGADTHVRNNATTTNFSTEPAMNIGESNASTQVGRGFIKFDLTQATTGIPPSAIITSVVLSIWTAADYSSNARQIQVFRVLKPMVISGVTWNKYDGTTDWAAAGGFDATDCEQTGIGSATLSASESDDTEIPITLNNIKFQEWISGVKTNNGIMIKFDTEANDMYQFHAAESATTACRPKLVVNWNDGGGGYTLILNTT